MGECPICQASFLLLKDLESHVECHFLEDSVPEEHAEKGPSEVGVPSQQLNPPPPPSAIQRLQRPVPTVFPAGTNLIQLLAACLEREAGESTSYGLCGPVDHYATQRTTSGWGCGYHNMQILASHLLAARPETKQLMFGGAGFVPDIPGLQAWLEAAWQAGYDAVGAEQLAGHVQGTRKWVGATEVAALLRSFGLRAQIVDFGDSDKPKTSAAGQATGTSMKDHLLHWVWRYFTASAADTQPSSDAAGQAAKRQRQAPPPRVRMSGLPPLFFQHEGHSRTIIGIKRKLVGREQRADYTLLILDPSTPGPGLAAALVQDCGWKQMLKRGAHTLRHPQFQLVFVQPGTATGEEKEGLKLIAAVESY